MRDKKVRVHIDNEVRELDTSGRCPSCEADWSFEPAVPVIDRSYYHEPYAYACPRCGSKWNRFLISL